MRFLPLSADALLVEVDTTAEATSLYLDARAAGIESVDVVPGERSVLFDGVRDLTSLAHRLSAMPRHEPVGAPGRVVEVPTVYDGEDLPDIAALWDMSVDEVIETHGSTPMVVAFCGFAPGFAYCVPGIGVRPVDGDRPLDQPPTRPSVPRHASPRPRVPAGSVALAGGFTGVYPTASPGGWRLIGRTDVTLWDIRREPPATLTPGTRVSFPRVDG